VVERLSKEQHICARCGKGTLSTVGRKIPEGWLCFDCAHGKPLEPEDSFTSKQVTLQLAIDAVRGNFALCTAEGEALVAEIELLRQENARLIERYGLKDRLIDHDIDMQSPGSSLSGRPSQEGLRSGGLRPADETRTCQWCAIGNKPSVNGMHRVDRHNIPCTAVNG